MSLNIKKSIMSGLTCLVNAEIIKAIVYCGKEYGFNAEDALKMYLKSLGEGEEEKGKCKSKKNKKLSYPIPYNGTEMEGCCKGLKQNNGLYTQCEYKPLKSSELCGVCTKNKCRYGRIEQRMESELYEYVDPSGKKVTGYLKVLRKLKLDVLEVKERLKADGITIVKEHFDYEEEESKVEKKGRPKKAKKTMEKKEETEVDDIFESTCAAVAVSVVTRERSHTLPTEETLTREIDGMMLEDVKDVKKVQRKAESKKAVKEKVVKSKVVKSKVSKVVKEKAEEEEEVDVVKKVEIDGKKYLKSKKTGVIYNMDQDAIGVWNERTEKIDFNEEDEESEEEYEEEEIISCSGGGNGVEV